MRGFCVMCGGGIAHHHETTIIREGKAHESCTGEEMNPPVRKE